MVAIFATGVIIASGRTPLWFAATSSEPHATRLLLVKVGLLCQKSRSRRSLCDGRLMLSSSTILLLGISTKNHTSGRKGKERKGKEDPIRYYSIEVQQQQQSFCVLSRVPKNSKEGATVKLRQNWANQRATRKIRTSALRIYFYRTVR